MPILTLLSNPRAIGYILVITVLFSAGWYVNGIRWENKLESRLKEQQSLLTRQCNDAKKITEQANDDLQTKLSDINKRLASSKRVHPVMSIIPSVAEHSSSGREYAGQGRTVVGTSDDFRDYFAECESYRSEVILLDDFGRKNCK